MKRNMRTMTSFVLIFSMVMGLFSGLFQTTKAQAETTAEFAPILITDYNMLSTPSRTSLTLKGTAESVPGSQETIVPVKLTKTGVLELGASANSNYSAMEMGLFSDPACLSSVGTSVAIPANSTQVVTNTYSVPSANTYYLRFKWASAVPVTTAAIELDAYAYQGEETTLNDSLQAIYTADGSKKLYHKLVVKKAGMVAVTGNTYQEIGSNLQVASMTFQLCNSKKAPIYNASLSNLNNYSEEFALKKGTYYVAVDTNLRYQLKRSFASWTDQSGAKKSKAKLLKKGKKVNGMVLMTDSVKKADWYKVKLSKRTKMKLNVGVYCTGTGSNLKVQVIPANKHYKLLDNTVMLGNSSGKKLVSRTKMNKGIYYIKVTKVTKSFSGVYRLQLK